MTPWLAARVLRCTSKAPMAPSSRGCFLVPTQAADDASKAGAARDMKDRGPFLRVLEAALVAAHKPVTLLLPAATTILALRETSRWLEILLDLHDDHLPRFAAYTASLAIQASHAAAGRSK
jgi:hypothetical protein